jgi:Spy/CpxP family protein refolding chaperone
MTRLNMMLMSAFVLVGSAFAQRGPGGGTPPTSEEMISRRVEHLATRLELTADQKAQATTILTEEATALRALQSQMREASTALRDAIRTSGLDADIERAATQLGTLHGTMATVQGKAQARLRGILTADQKAKLDSTEGRRGMGMRGGPGGFGGRR